MSENLNTAAEIIRDLASEKIQFKTINGVHYALYVDDGELTVKVIADNPEPAKYHKPQFIERTATCDTLDSFVDYVGRFGTQNTIITVNDDRVRANIDASSPNETDHEQHRVDYNCEWSPAASKWNAIRDNWLSQTDFLRFLEARTTDTNFLTPQHADIEEVIGDLRIVSGQNVRSVANAQGGNVAMTFDTSTTTQNKAGGEVTIPRKLHVSFPILNGMPNYDVQIALRYDAKNGDLPRFLIDWINRDAVFDQAMQDVFARLSSNFPENLVIRGSMRDF